MSLLEVRMMEIRVTLSEPSSVKREGDKWILSFDELGIWEFSEDDIPIFERLYELGWKPSDEFLETMCKELPVEFVLRHESRERVVDTLRRLLRRNDYDTVRKFGSVLTPEDREAMVREKIEEKRRNDRWFLVDYDMVVPLVQTFPEVFRKIPLPEEFVDELLRDLGRWQKWVKCPVSFGYETRNAGWFRRALETAKKLKELGVLPEAVERRVEEVARQICGVLVRRLTSPRIEYENKDIYAEVAKSLLPFADDGMRARILSALLEMGNGE